MKDLDKARALYSGFGAFIYEGQAKSSYARIEGHPYPDELQAAFKAFDDQDYTAAASKAEPFAKKGVAAAQFLLGEVAYHNKDYDAAVDWYRKAAKQDDRDAQFGVGTGVARMVSAKRKRSKG